MIEVNLKKQLNTPSGNMSLSIDMNIIQGKIITLYGESGAGKTSVLRMIAGLLSPDEGSIVVNKEVWFNSKENINLKPQERKIGFVFQDFALFSNMTVRGNLEYALNKEQNKKEIDEIILAMELGDLQHKKVDKLSGGQKQRVALARGLVQSPDILLLDEPLSALDNKMRSKLQDYVLKYHTNRKNTIILISHDIDEILKLSDEVYCIKNGSIVESGIPSKIFKSPVKKSVQLEGIITNLQKEETNTVATINIGNSFFKISIPDLEAKDYCIGATINLDSQIMVTNIQKK